MVKLMLANCNVKKYIKNFNIVHCFPSIFLLVVLLLCELQGIEITSPSHCRQQSHLKRGPTGQNWFSPQAYSW